MPGTEQHDCDSGPLQRQHDLREEGHAQHHGDDGDEAADPGDRLRLQRLQADLDEQERGAPWWLTERTATASGLVASV